MKLRKDKMHPSGTVEIKGSMKPIKRIGLCLLIAGSIAILYFNSLGNHFTNWDDGMIYQNATIRHLNWEGIKTLFTYRPGNTYQPVRMLSYAVDYHFWKLNPMGYRMTSIFFYMLTCIMVFLALQHLSANLRENFSPDSHERVALFGSFIFAAHPVHVEAVTWLAARKEVLQGSFFFLGFYLYLKGREKIGKEKILYFGLVLFSFLLAVLSKPSAIVFPAVILVYEIAQRKNKWIDYIKSHWLFFTLSSLISILFVSILMKVMIEAGGVKPYRGGSFFSNLLVSFYVFLYNIKLLVFKINYSAAYTLSVSNPILSLRTSIFAGITVFLFGLAFWSLKRSKVIFFSFLFFFVTLLPYLNIIPISTLLADRYVFIASFSYCLLLGIIFDRLYAYKNKRFTKGFFKLLAIVLFLFMFTVYSFMTVRQNKIWENSYTLWADAVAKHPGSNTANALMGVVYMDLGMDEKAVEYLEKAIQILPYDYQSRNNLGIVYGRLDQPEKAYRELTTAIHLKPDEDNIKVNLAVFYQMQKDYQKAEEVLKGLLSKNSQNANLHFRLGLVYREAGQYEAAISELIKSMELAPHIINPYEELGNLYASRIQDVEKAKYYYTQGIEAVSGAKFKAGDLRWMVQDLER